MIARDRGGVAAAASEIKARGLGGVAFVSAAGDGTVSARAVAAVAGAEAIVDRLGRAADTSLAAALLGDVVLVEGYDPTEWAAQRDALVARWQEEIGSTR